MFYYVTADENGFIVKISKKKQADTAQEKWVQVFVTTDDEANFVTFFDKFRVDDHGVLLAPNNLPPKASLNALQVQVKELVTQNATLTKEFESSQQIISMLAGQAGGAQ